MIHGVGDVGAPSIKKMTQKSDARSHGTMIITLCPQSENKKNGRI